MVGGGVDHRCRRPHRTSRTVEENEEAVPGGLHLSPAEALDLSTQRLVVLGQQQPPPGVTEPVERLRRPGQVGEDDGREDAIGDLLWRLREEPTAGPVNRYPRLVADDPGVVTGRYLESIATHDIQRGAVGHLDMQMPGHHVPDVVHLAALSTDDWLDMLRPTPAWLEYGPPDSQLS
jgi:hypothetical protein